MEFNSPIELYNWMHKNISYKHTGKFLSVEEVMKNKYGDCHDQANFACHYLTKMGLKCGRLFMVEYNTWNSPGGATHTLVYFIQNNKYYWFENAWGNQSGIHKPFNTLQELKDDIASKWNYSGKNTKLYMSEYKSVKPGSSLNDYVIINTPENNPKKYYSKNKDEIKMNSKVLENFLIPEVAEEGIISNFKAKREQKKAEREEKKRLARERDNECKNLLPKVMNDLKEIVSKYKTKYPDLPIDPYYDTDKTVNEVFVCVFDDIEIMNEYSDNYNKKSIMVFKAIYNAVKNYCSTSEKKYPGFDLQCDVPENGYIHIRVY